MEVGRCWGLDVFWTVDWQWPASQRRNVCLCQRYVCLSPNRSVTAPPTNSWIQSWIVVTLLPKVELDSLAPLSNISEVLVSDLCRLQAILGENFYNSPQLLVLQLNEEMYLEVRFPISLFTKYPHTGNQKLRCWQRW